MADVKVRLLRNKRWPHPNGPKRAAGTDITVPEATAVAWERAGLVQRTQARGTGSKAADATQPAPDAAAAAEAEGATAPAPTAEPDAPPVRKRPTSSRKRKK